ncbi:MAG: PilZ domain-containing protein [Candidatus Omnitrophica bacterium]|nr:PilZ domain-containing protein [Candidatus Omnitrophota bacterium]
MGRERRKFERVESIVNVRYTSRGGKFSGNSLTKDVSECGACLACGGLLPAGLALDVVIDKGDADTIKVPAKVVWSRRNSEHWKPRYSAGVEFKRLDTANRNTLVRYAKEKRWIKSDFERSLEENKVPVLNSRGEFF